MVNSKQKGKRGEREAAAALRAIGIEARRGQQFKGTEDSPDLDTAIPGIHFEVKRTEALRLRDALRQAVSESGSKIPVVLHRWSRGEWLVIHRLSDWPEVSSCVEQGRGRGD